MMDSTAHHVPPYASRDDFLAHSLNTTTLQQPLDCSICHEPLLTATATTLIRPSCVNQSLPRVSISDENTSATLEELVPEVPVRIRHCRHMFGRTCLTTWFDSIPSAHRCPECTVILFPASRIHLALRRPTRAERLQFSNLVEYVLQDAEGAVEIREELMSERTAFKMRELTLEIFRQQGWVVTWEYVDQEDEGNTMTEQFGNTNDDHGALVTDEYSEDAEVENHQKASQDSD